MLTQWRLTNFKSVIDEAVLELAPLTIFTGANSAGKSTIIQSILLTAQTIQSSVVSRPVVLNGHMTRLGAYKDIVSYGNVDENISVGFNLDAQASEVGLARPSRYGRAAAIGGGMNVRQISFNYSFSVTPGPNEDVDKDLLGLQPSLVSADLSVSYLRKGEMAQDQLHIQRSNDPIARRIELLRLDGSRQDGLASSLKYTVNRAPTVRGYSSRNEGLEVTQEPVGAYMQHFLPRYLVGRFDEVSATVSWQLSLLTEVGTYRRSSFSGEFPNDPVPRSVAEHVSNVLRPLLVNEGSPLKLLPIAKVSLLGAISDFTKDLDVQKFSSVVRRASPRDQSQVFAILSAEKQKLTSLLRSSRSASYDLEIVHLNEHLSFAVDFLSNYFSSSVRYLGPLRDEPKPVYPLSGTSEPSDVGFRGEHTAAVLDVHRNSVIRYVPSAQFDAEWVELDPTHATLALAVQDWLKYMGVGQEFYTSDLGKLGHELKVSTVGSTLQHDLTQVGVGVSQVLPILVLALLADAGSTLVFEQPELHLHPRVQSRLADFFVSMSRLGKQCVVETHSEYIINRLRLRAASEIKSRVASESIIYFVENESGKSVYRRISIDELGGLDKWPSGFFDEGEISTSALLRQGLKKRKRGGVDDGSDP